MLIKRTERMDFGGSISVSCYLDGAAVRVTVTLAYDGVAVTTKPGSAIAASCGAFGPAGAYETGDRFPIAVVYGTARLTVTAPPRKDWRDMHSVTVYAYDEAEVIADGSVEVCLGTSGRVTLINGATAFTNGKADQPPLVSVGKGCCMHSWKSHGGAHAHTEEGGECIGDGVFPPHTVRFNDGTAVGDFSNKGAEKYLRGLGYYPDYGIWRMKGDRNDIAHID